MWLFTQFLYNFGATSFQQIRFGIWLSLTPTSMWLFKQFLYNFGATSFQHIRFGIWLSLTPTSMWLFKQFLYNFGATSFQQIRFGIWLSLNPTSMRFFTQCPYNFGATSFQQIRFGIWLSLTPTSMRFFTQCPYNFGATSFQQIPFEIPHKFPIRFSRNSFCNHLNPNRFQRNSSQNKIQLPIKNSAFCFVLKCPKIYEPTCKQLRCNFRQISITESPTFSGSSWVELAGRVLHTPFNNSESHESQILSILVQEANFDKFDITFMNFRILSYLFTHWSTNGPLQVSYM